MASPRPLKQYQIKLERLTSYPPPLSHDPAQHPVVHHQIYSWPHSHRCGAAYQPRHGVVLERAPRAPYRVVPFS